MSIHTTFEVHLLRLPVWFEDPDGRKVEYHVVLEKAQLQAAGLIGLSSKEVITRLCARQGFKLLDVGKAERLTVTLDLERLWELYRPEEETEGRF